MTRVWLCAAVWLAAGVVHAGPIIEQVTPLPRTPGERFGWSVAIAGDRAVVTAPGRQIGVYTAAGVVFPLIRGEDGWAALAPLDEMDTAYYSRSLGHCAALSSEVLALCAPGYNMSYGAVSLYHLEGMAWVRDQVVFDTPVMANDRLGVSVAASGTTVVMGSTVPTVPVADMIPGRARVWDYAGVWTEAPALIPSDSEGGDRFGLAAAIDGDVLVIGAPGKEMSRGAAYVFVREAGVWTQTAKLVRAEDRQPSDLFGSAVAIAGDVVVVGAYGRSSTAGAAYVFERTGEVWAQTQELLSPAPVQGELFGNSVGVSPGYAMASGYGYEYVAPFGSRGGGYLYGRLAEGYGLLATLRGDATVPGDYVGFGAALSGSTALLGAPYDDAPPNLMAMAPGAAYVYRLAQAVGEACVVTSDCAEGTVCCDERCAAEEDCVTPTTGEPGTSSGGPTETTAASTGGSESGSGTGPPTPEIDPLSEGCGCRGTDAAAAGLVWVLVGVPRRRRR